LNPTSIIYGTGSRGAPHRFTEKENTSQRYCANV
jgi:hypothetical protein